MAKNSKVDSVILIGVFISKFYCQSLDLIMAMLLKLVQRLSVAHKIKILNRVAKLCNLVSVHPSQHSPFNSNTVGFSYNPYPLYLPLWQERMLLHHSLVNFSLTNIASILFSVKPSYFVNSLFKSVVTFLHKIYLNS